MDKSTIILIVVAFTIGFALMFFDNPLKSFLAPKLAPVTQHLNPIFGGISQLLHGAVNSYIEGFRKSPGTVLITTGGAVLGVVGLFAKAYTYLKTKATARIQESESAASQANASAVSALEENQQLKEKLAIYEQDGPAATTLKEINQAQAAEISNLKAQLNDLTTRYNTLKHDFDQLTSHLIPDPDAHLRKTA